MSGCLLLFEIYRSSFKSQVLDNDFIRQRIKIIFLLKFPVLKPT